jgi:hypothetical protein
MYIVLFFFSLMTIGFGDFVPGIDYVYHLNVDDGDWDEVEAQSKVIMGTVYILLGMAVVAMCFNLMQEKIVQQGEIQKIIKYFVVLGPSYWVNI